MPSIVENYDDWLSDLCADKIESLNQVLLSDGIVYIGDIVHLNDSYLSKNISEELLVKEHTAKILDIAIGKKGKKPFEKKLWTYILVLLSKENLISNSLIKNESVMLRCSPLEILKFNSVI